MHITRSLTACALLSVWLLPSCQLTSSPPETETAPADWTPLTSEALATSRKDISFSITF